MNQNNNKTNQLIEMIYESALEPHKWADLLNALAEFVDKMEKESDSNISEHGLLSIMPNINGDGEHEEHTSLSKTLKSISEFNEDENLPEIQQVNDLLIGHFARALKIAKRLVDTDEQHNIVLSLLDRMPIALALVDHNACVIETNALADELFISTTGISNNSNVLDVGHENNARFLEVVKQMSKHDSAITQGQTFLISSQGSKNNIMLFIAPLQQKDSQQSASVAVFISQRKALHVSLPTSFSETYALTNKELEITQSLIQGLSIKEISEEKNVSPHTVRSQVKSIMHKTETSRQAELVSLVYNGMSDFVTSLADDEQGKRSSILNKSQYLLQDYNVIQLSDGRNLAYTEYGDPNGEPLFHCHSVLGSRLELATDAEKISQEKSVRLIVMDRPGFGASDPNPNMAFVAWVNDLVQLADHLNIEKFSLTGYAMGGQYALACAHEIPERLKYVAIISSGMAPQSKSDYNNMIPLYKMSNRLAKHIPTLYKLMMTIAVKGVSAEQSSFFSQFQEYLGSADQEIMKSPEFKKNIYASLIEGIKQGGKSNPQEAVMLMNDWGFKLENIKVPINIWHGTSDYHVPSKLGQRYSEHINNTNLFIKEGQGHYMFYNHWSEILDELLSEIKPLILRSGT